MSYLPVFTLETWILLITLICLFIIYGKWTYGIFEKLGIPGPKPTMYLGTIFKSKLIYYLDDVDYAQKYGRIWGMYELKKPMLAVMDPDMLKTILVKECFTYFPKRRDLPLTGELYDSVGFLEGADWRRIRNILSSSFSSGHMKAMFSIMKRHSSQLTSSLQPKVENNEVISVKDFFGSYSMNVATSSMFGVEMNPSPFIRHASNFLRFSTPLFFLQGFFPILIPLLEMLGVSFFPKDSMVFFKKVVEKIRRERDGSSQQKSGDILQHMINAQTAGSKNEKSNKGLSDHEIVSQAAMFTFAGYEMNSTALSFLAYCLARNPEVMKRLQEEIDLTFPNMGPVKYEGLMQMEYLDCVVNECLRMHPPVARLERTAIEAVEINGITIPKNMLVVIPIYALHHDPELWPEPEEFKPDRFSKQNKQRINPYTYLPFGHGPRNCLGMRFTLLLIKLALVEVLQKYSFSVCKETEIPLTMDPKSIYGPLKPIKLKMVPR